VRWRGLGWQHGVVVGAYRKETTDGCNYEVKYDSDDSLWHHALSPERHLSWHGASARPPDGTWALLTPQEPPSGVTSAIALEVQRAVRSAGCSPSSG
jgi:hypothetical protein